MVDFAVRLGFYKIMGENDKAITVNFDGSEVASVTVLPTDSLFSPRCVEFTVDKDPGIYPCLLEVASNIGDGESVGLVILEVKPCDQTEWFEVLPNGLDNSDGSLVVSNPRNGIKTLTALWYDEPVVLNIEVVGAREPKVMSDHMGEWPEFGVLQLYRYGFTSFDHKISYYENERTIIPERQPIWRSRLALLEDLINQNKELRSKLEDPNTTY